MADTMTNANNTSTEMKYVLVSGGVISGVGKGIISSSVGLLLKSRGYYVTMIKIDPYLNIDAGTFSPYEHGEVFVLDDGSEVDLDLGNYERFLDITLRSENNITTGRVYQSVIAKERQGVYLGKTVQVVPHITDEIQAMIEKAAHLSVPKAHVCIIELGGTVGDIESMPFVEALRQFQFRVSKENFCNIHVSLVPYLKTSGESKTKPTQESVRTLRKLGLQPHIMVCRSEVELDEEARNKVSMFCDVPKNQVITLVDQKCVLQVPLTLEELGLGDLLVKTLCMKERVPNDCLIKWRELVQRSDSSVTEVHIAIVGKYAPYRDAYTSVIKALKHAAALCCLKLDLLMINSADLESKSSEAWSVLAKAQGIVLPGGFGYRGVEGKIAAACWARTHNIPLLGICLGLQCTVIEFCRNVLHIEKANSEEFGVPKATNVIIEMPEHNPVGAKGGTMRLGLKKSIFRGDHVSIVRELYSNQPYIEERHRHRYEVNTKYVPALEEKGMMFVATSEDSKRMEIMELKGHPYYVAVQFHPEYLSRALRPSPVYVGLIARASDIPLSKLHFSYSDVNLNKIVNGEMVNGKL